MCTLFLDENNTVGIQLRLHNLTYTLYKSSLSKWLGNNFFYIIFFLH